MIKVIGSTRFAGETTSSDTFGLSEGMMPANF